MTDLLPASESPFSIPASIPPSAHDDTPLGRARGRVCLYLYSKMKERIAGAETFDVAILREFVNDTDLVMEKIGPLLASFVTDIDQLLAERKVLEARIEQLEGERAP